jgi:excisionase family DNA binding protein
METTSNRGSDRPREFLSLEEVADLLGVTYQLIYKLVRSGELPAARIGKVYRIGRRDLDQYLEQSKGHAGGGVCSVCGTTYHSRLSLKNTCSECGEPICVDCWTRRKVRACPAHAPAGSISPKAGGNEGSSRNQTT